MASLTGKTPAATYKDLIQVSNSNSGIDTTLRNISDGEGTSAALQISTTAVQATGTLEVDGELTADTIAASTLNVILGAVYPVGSYYMNETVSTNPATLLGFGTWTAVLDKFIVAHGSTYTATGGAATDSITVTEANLPSTLTVTVVTGDVGDSSSDGFATASATAAGTMSQQLTNVGSGSAISVDIIPPYQAAYVWKRTA